MAGELTPTGNREHCQQVPPDPYGPQYCSRRFGFIAELPTCVYIVVSKSTDWYRFGCHKM